MPSRPILSPHVLTECLIARLHVWRLPGMKGFAPEAGVEKHGQSRVSGRPDNFRMLLEFPEDLLAQGIGDLSINAGVLDVLVPQVISDILNPAAGFQEMDSHGMAESMDGARLDAGDLGVIGEELLHLALLQGPLAASEQVRPDISALTQIAANEFGGVPPQRLFAAKPILQSPNCDAMVLKVDIIDGEHQCFAYAQAVVVDQAEEGPVAGGLDGREDACELVLGEVFGECRHGV